MRRFTLLLALALAACNRFDGAVKGLHDKDTNARLHAIRTLKELNDARAVEPLSDVLRHDAEDVVRAAAAEALGAIGDPRAIPALIDGLAVKRDGPPPTFQEINAFTDPVQMSANALGRIGKSAFDPVFAAFNGARDELKAGAALALGAIGDRRAVEPLLATVDSHDVSLQVAWVIALGRLRDARAAAPLRAIRDGHEFSWAQEPARKALSSLEGETGHIVADSHSPNAEARYAAVWTLENSDSAEAVTALIGALGDPEGRVRHLAAEALLKVAMRHKSAEIQRAVPALSKAFREDADRAAANALSMLGDAARGVLIAETRNTNAAVRELAARNLASAEAASVAALLAAIRDPAGEVRLAAASSLACCNAPGANEALEDALARRDLAAIAGAYPYFIHLGRAGSEDALVAALNSYGGATMAQTFLNCGNSTLSKAAAAWAGSHGYRIERDYLAGANIASGEKLAWGQ